MKVTTDPNILVSATFWTGNSDFIITYDFYLLKQFENIKIITPEEFLKLI